MNESAADYWMNTVAAQGYSGLPAMDLGRYLISIMVVVVVMLALAYLAKKAGWLKAPVTNEAPVEQEKLIFYSRFSQDQTILVMTQEQAVHCYITKGDKTVMATVLPGVVPALSKPSRPAAGPGASKSFQAIWMKMLQKKKGQQDER